jgi:hypothetical protein
MVLQGKLSVGLSNHPINSFHGAPNESQKSQIETIVTHTHICIYIYIYNIHTHIEHIHHTFIVWTWRHVHNSLFRWAPYLKAISFQTSWWKPRSKSNQLPNHGSNFCGCHGYISLCARISNRSIKLLGRYRLLDVSFWCVHSNAQNLSSRNARWSKFGGSNYFKLPQKKICALPSASELQKSLPALLIIPGPCSSLVMLLPLEGIRYYCCVKLNKCPNFVKLTVL